MFSIRSDSSPIKPAQPWLNRILLLLLLTFSLAFLFRSAYVASDLSIVPDSVEYAIGAWRLANLSHFNISINGHSYPSRYPPGFSTILLAPVYLLFPNDIGNGIYAILGMALIGVWGAWVYGCRVGNVWSGALAALSVMVIKDYRFGAERIMSDLPTAVLGFLGLLVFLDLLSASRPKSYLFAGVLTAAAFQFRYDMLSMALPFCVLITAGLRSRDKRRDALKGGLLFLIPVIVSIFATLFYNKAVFGSFTYTGYNYWCAFPYDFPNKLWSLRYIAPNLHDLMATRVLVVVLEGIIGAWILYKSKNPLLWPSLFYLIAACAPSFLLHLVYRFQGSRFALMEQMLLAAIGGAGLATLIPKRLQDKPVYLAGILLCLQPLIPLIHSQFHKTPWRRVIADRIAAHTPDNAVIVSGIDPVYLSWFLLRGTGRERIIIPLSRKVEYAAKYCFPQRPANPSIMPHSGNVHTAAMKRVGGIDSVPWTAEGRPDKLLSLARTGRPIYAELHFAPADYPDAYTSSLFHFIHVPEAPELIQMQH